MSRRDLSAFIGHVVMAMRFVADFIDGMTLDDFLADRRTRDAVIRNCEVIGEAALMLCLLSMCISLSCYGQSALFLGQTEWRQCPEKSFGVIMA